MSGAGPTPPDATDPDAAARLIERLLADSSFRDTFRRDPVKACRDGGLDEIADEMAGSAGKAMFTMDLRESKSSLAGVMMAAAIEGVAVFEVLEHFGQASHLVEEVMSRVNLPAMPDLPRIGHGAAAAASAPADLSGIDPAVDAGRGAAGAGGGGAPPGGAADASTGGAGADAAGTTPSASDGSGSTAGRDSASDPFTPAPDSPALAALAGGAPEAGGLIPDDPAGGPADPLTPAAGVVGAEPGAPAGAGAAGGNPAASAGAGVAGTTTPHARDTVSLLVPNGQKSSVEQAHSLVMMTPDQQAAPPWAPPPATAPPVDGAGVAELASVSGPGHYPGDAAPKAQLAAWMGEQAHQRGLPRELPVMASLVESGLHNVHGGDRDSVGYFQMRVGIWNEGPYAGYPDDPKLQVKWFLDQAVAVKKQRIANGLPIDDPRHFGDWIADVERPAAEYRGRYQLRLDQAQGLLRQGSGAAGAPADAAPPAPAAASPLIAADPTAAKSMVSAVDPAGAGAHRGLIDPSDFGQGQHGHRTPEIDALLSNPKVHFDATGQADLKAGRIDPRIVAVLTKVSEEHDITVSCMCSDHAKMTTGGSVSNHSFGRGVDIAAVDGQPVNSGNPIAHEIAAELSSMDPHYRPTEIGSPWAIAGPAYFTDAAHQDHLHIGFDDAITPSWTPPSDVAAAPSAAVAAPGAAPEAARLSLNAAGASPAAGVPAAAAPAVAGTPPAADSLAMIVPTAEQAASAAKAHTISMLVPESPAGGAPGAAAGGVAGAPPAAVAADGSPLAQPAALTATPGDASAAADALTAGAGGTQASPKALAAVHEARKYLGTPYLWGGSSPQTGFDCSGLMQWAYAQQGIKIPRVTYTQIDAPNAIHVSRRHLLPGDLVFFQAGGDVHHVGMSLGGDTFIHAPHTGDVVKVSSLNEPYYKEQFAGGRRFAAAVHGSAGVARGVVPAAGPAPATPLAAGQPVAQQLAVDPAAVADAHAGRIADATELSNPHSMVFLALAKQEASHERHTMQFLQAIRPEDAAAAAAGSPSADPAALAGPPPAAGTPAAAAAGSPLAADAADAAATPGAGGYPGDSASRQELARWLAAKARKAGLPGELPVMASLVESRLQNLSGGDRDSVGFFQMRVGIWDQGPYEGFRDRPELQAKWFIDQALAVKHRAGSPTFGRDPSTWGEWIADIERPAEQYRGRYQLRLAEARRLLSGGG